MLIYDMRWIIRDGEKVLQVRIAEVVDDEYGNIAILKPTEWKDVPVVSEEQANG